MTKPAFQPAPRPRPRTTAEDAGRLAEATGDLGFTRPSTAPAAATAPASGPDGQKPKGAVASQEASLKLAVPQPLARELRQAALDRGVTVRYLILEALSEKGYRIDLASIPEDGRRNR